jgi:transcriptional regulator with XRE-family HTH domain
LKKARAKAGLSQREVSNALGYSTAQFISNWERGVSTPPVSGIHRIARVYGIAAQELFEHLLAQVLEDTRSQMTLEFREARKA